MEKKIVIDPVSNSIPVSTWSKSSQIEYVTENKRLGEERRLSRVFRTIFYEFQDGTVKLQDYTSDRSTVDLKV